MHALRQPGGPRRLSRALVHARPCTARQVRDGAGQVTLAIGDGANDVSMIQARPCAAPQPAPPCARPLALRCGANQALQRGREAHDVQAWPLCSAWSLPCAGGPAYTAPATVLHTQSAHACEAGRARPHRLCACGQAAHVGVGISGQEGMQAVMAADFAIAQARAQRLEPREPGPHSTRRWVRAMSRCMQCMRKRPATLTVLMPAYPDVPYTRARSSASWHRCCWCTGAGRTSAWRW